MIRPISIAFFILTFLAGTIASAQILDGGVQPRVGTFGNQGGAYYNFAGGSGCDFKVSVWGFVNNPGRYNIPCETNLLEMLSFCGGARRGADLKAVKVIRKGMVDRQNQIEKVFVVNLEKYLAVTDTSRYREDTELLLMPGDLVVLSGEEPTDNVLRISQVVVAVASFTTALIAVLNYSKK